MGLIYFFAAADVLLVLRAVFSPRSYLRERVDRVAEFGVGYSHDITQGEIIRRLSSPTHTVFIEEWDELIYWQAKRPSAYRYVWWSSTLADAPKYRDAKDAIGREILRIFTWGCATVKTKQKRRCLAPSQTSTCVSRKTANLPACLFAVRTAVAREITPAQWQSVLDFSVDTPLFEKS